MVMKFILDSTQMPGIITVSCGCITPLAVTRSLIGVSAAPVKTALSLSLLTIPEPHVIVAMKVEFTRFYQRSANLFLAEQAQAYLRGAEDLASLALLADYDADKNREQPRDDLEEIWAQPSAPYPLDEGGWLSGELVDLQGRFNLNALAVAAPGGDGAPRFTPAAVSRSPKKR